MITKSVFLLPMGFGSCRASVTTGDCGQRTKVERAAKNDELPRSSEGLSTTSLQKKLDRSESWIYLKDAYFVSSSLNQTSRLHSGEKNTSISGCRSKDSDSIEKEVFFRFSVAKMIALMVNMISAQMKQKLGRLEGCVFEVAEIWEMKSLGLFNIQKRGGPVF